MIVFGGFIKGARSNDLHLFNFDSLAWEELSPISDKDNVPCKRAASSITAVDGKVYLFGGQDDDNNKLNDLWVFDLGSKSWS
jgi:hypothetical protein